MEIFLMAGYSLAKTLASFGVPATLRQPSAAAAISGTFAFRPSVIVATDQMNMPAFHWYWPEVTYS